MSSSDVPAPLPDDPALREDPSARAAEPGDAGVPGRTARRAERAALLVGAAVLAIVVVVAAVLTRHSAAAPTTIFVGAVVVYGAFLAGVTSPEMRRARRWRVAEADAATWVAGWQVGALSDSEGPVGWVRAVCGPPMPLSPMRNGRPLFPWQRRRPQVVLPIRSATGPLSDGQAVVVQARSDKAVPAAGDELQVRVLGRLGPFLIARPSDGVVFAADRRPTRIG